MRVFILGKPREVTHWTEDCAAGFQAAGHEVRLGVTRDARLHPGIERALMARWTGGPLVSRLLRAIRAFGPDLILAVRALATPAPILDAVAAMKGRPPLAGWVGDVFAEHERPIADRFDLLAYTDTAMLTRHRALGFRATGIYLPHAANTRLLDAARAYGAPPSSADAPSGAADRDLGLVFVANPTPRRRAVLTAMTHAVSLFGPGWAPIPGTPHAIEARGVDVAELGRIYAASAGVLNIHNEGNVAFGLNQRHFDPPLFGVPVLSDAQPDLPSCFDPGREVLVWQDDNELNALHERVLADPAWARSIGQAAHRRVMADHLYGHRLNALRDRL